MSSIYEAWSEEEIAELIKLIEEGDSYCEVAEKLNRTRGSVAGRVFRMGLKSRPEKRKSNPVPKAPKKKKKKPTFFCAPHRKALKKARLEPLLPPATKTDDNREWVKSIIDLEPHQCRYPRGEGTLDDPFEFCGKQKEPGSSYCTEHREICTNGVTAPKDKQEAA